ncbi:MAG: Serine/threonine-protein kinase pkn1 [Candidatus Accumulibacter adjunctus]|uniref:Serine/threonine-protein kinase pkn1 n=1 Tax=Candidatus Accumulibacter adjunctus TaxID=1454001 RepID=A0A011NPS4_9PROT|nr:MAG: Serine/threonine-protein kinase pkn1 [Candidatus Accumulibacter adjunctus]
MTPLERATRLLQPQMGSERRDTLLTLAFHGELRPLYDAIDQAGASDAFTVACVRTLLERGCVGSRHALSLLLEVAQSRAGDEKRADFAELIAELDAGCVREPDADCPYRDLRAFREEDEPLFFGRDACTRELVAAVDRCPLVAVVGASGSGKSSVVQAGLIPLLRRRGGWLVAIVRPGPEPWRSLAGCLLEQIEGEPAADQRVQRQLAIGELAGELARGVAGGARVGLTHLVDSLLAVHPGSRHLLLLVDQWEELYTYRETDAATAAAFADRLIEASARAPLRIVLTLRADFTGRAIDHRPLRDHLQQATVFLGGMNRDERERAIRGPAETAGLRFEPGLVARLLDEVGDEPGNLPLLEFCLTQLHARRQDGALCQAGFEAIGGVRGAIVRRADELIDELAARAPGSEAIARDVFLQLVQLGDGSDDTRRRAPLGDFADASRALIGELANARLLVTGRDAGSGQETVEVAHEALIRNWPRLRDWLQQDRDDLHQRREIGRATAAWTAHGDSHRWPDERVMLETAPMLQRLAPRFALSESERRFLGPLAVDEMLALLDDPATTHALRATIGDRLALLPGGDPRPGVGLRPDGLPDIAWHEIPGGEVELEVDASGLLRRWRGRPRFAAEPFRIARHPVTVAQWRVFLAAADGYEALVRRVRGWDAARQRGRDNQPAVDLTWYEAMAYCQWLGAALGHAVRLPTEWEWQLAASGGDPLREYPWGDWHDGRANTSESELGRMTAVGVYPPGASEQGVCDLAGNVWQWCLNRSDKPGDVTTGGDARRVVRGGSWNVTRGSARCAFRLGSDPGPRNLNLGLRLVCVSPILKR